MTKSHYFVTVASLTTITVQVQVKLPYVKCQTDMFEEDSEDLQHIDIYQSKNRSECKVYSR